MKTVLRFSLLGALLLGGHAFAAEPKKFDISMFPAAEVNQERVVIRLPEVENEADMMVELQVGKKMLVDCNLPRFAGNLEQHSVKGWGYNGPVGSQLWLLGFDTPDSAFTVGHPAVADGAIAVGA